MARNIVLDASALLAVIYQEKGGDIVRRHLKGAWISTVNLTEVATRIIRNGAPSQTASEMLNEFPLAVFDYDEPQALLAAELYPKTKLFGLSLGDRACLALAMTHKLPILTADRSWTSLKLGVKIECIR